MNKPKVNATPITLSEFDLIADRQAMGSGAPTMLSDKVRLTKYLIWLRFLEKHNE